MLSRAPHGGTMTDSHRTNSRIPPKSAVIRGIRTACASWITSGEFSPQMEGITMQSQRLKTVVTTWSFLYSPSHSTRLLRPAEAVSASLQLALLVRAGGSSDAHFAGVRAAAGDTITSRAADKGGGVALIIHAGCSHAGTGLTIGRRPPDAQPVRWARLLGQRKGLQ